MNLNQLDLNKLVTFCRVVEAGNYRLASEALNVTPSALSQSISSLEHSLGIQLFHRVGRRLVLTENGRQIQGEFQKYFRQVSESLLRISKADSEISGLIRVGAYQEFARFCLAPILVDFQRRYPLVQIKLVFDSPSRLHQFLENGRIDVCFSIFPERGNRFVSRSIVRSELLLLAPTGILKEKPSYKDVMSAPMIEYYLNHQPIRRWLYLHFRRKPQRLPIRTFAASAEMVAALVEKGHGIGIVPSYVLGAKMSRSVTVCRPTPRRLVDSIWMSELKSRSRSRSLDLFTSEVERGLAQTGRGTLGASHFDASLVQPVLEK